MNSSTTRSIWAAQTGLMSYFKSKTEKEDMKLERRCGVGDVGWVGEEARGR